MNFVKTARANIWSILPKVHARQIGQMCLRKIRNHQLCLGSSFPLPVFYAGLSKTIILFFNTAIFLLVKTRPTHPLAKTYAKVKFMCKHILKGQKFPQISFFMTTQTKNFGVYLVKNPTIFRSAGPQWTVLCLGECVGDWVRECVVNFWNQKRSIIT